MTQADTRLNSTWDLDRKHFMHPWTFFDSFKQDGSLVISSAEGCYVTDASGKKYFDGLAGLWCVNIGYGREEMVEAIAEQTRKLPFFNPFVDTTNEPAAQLAGKLAELAPGSLNHVFYSGGGSTANDTAYRLIQFYQRVRGKPEKRHIITRHESYHGSTFLAASLSGKVGDKVPEFGFLEDGLHKISCPDPYRRPANMTLEAFGNFLIDEFEQKVLELGAENVAAFFAEPVMGSGGVMLAPEGYLARIYALCQKYDILFVADEVVTAFGRVGHWFASKDMFGVQPDIINCAKGITSGYIPLGATIFSDEIYDVISAPGHDRYFPHGFTYSGHPVACAAALKNIEIIERESLCEHVREIGLYLNEQLATLLDLEIVGDVRGVGFMCCVENVADKESKALFPDEVNIAKRIADACEENGLIVRPVGHLNIISPPLTMTREQVDLLIGSLRKAIITTTDVLRQEGRLETRAPAHV